MISEALEEVFLEAIKNGLTIAAAQRLIGVSSHWHVMRCQSDPEWEARVNKHDAEGLKETLDIIREAGKSDWRAAESLLKRRYRKEYGDHQVIENTGEPQRFKIEIIDNGREEKKE